jgi:hypothetical protein
MDTRQLQTDEKKPAKVAETVMYQGAQYLSVPKKFL